MTKSRCQFSGKYRDFLVKGLTYNSMSAIYIKRFNLNNEGGKKEKNKKIKEKNKNPRILSKTSLRSYNSIWK